MYETWHPMKYIKMDESIMLRIQCEKCGKDHAVVEEYISCSESVPIAVSRRAYEGRFGKKISWHPDLTEILLEKIRNRYHILKDKKARNNDVYEEIAEEMKGLMPGLTASGAQIKWKNLKCAYFKYEEAKRQGGRFKARQPLHHETIGEILEQTRRAPALSQTSCGLPVMTAREPMQVQDSREDYPEIILTEDSEMPIQLAETSEENCRLKTPYKEVLNARKEINEGTKKTDFILEQLILNLQENRKCSERHFEAKQNHYTKVELLMEKRNELLEKLVKH